MEVLSMKCSGLRLDGPLSVVMARSVMSYFKPGMMKWHYQDGLVVMGVHEVGRAYGMRELVDWAASMYDPLVMDDGTIRTYRAGEFNLDQINAGRLLFDLYDETGARKYLLAIDRLKEQLERQPRTLNGIFWHKEIYPWQVWLDGLYMEGPFWTRAGHFEDVATQLVKVSDILKDPSTGLYYHAWDESRGQRWSNARTGLSPHFWSRSIGWYLMSCLDCLSYAPEGFDALKGQVSAAALDLLGSVYGFQDAGGMWYQVPDRPKARGNYLETSGSAMFCYAALKAAAMGLTDMYVEKACKGIDGIVSRYMTQNDGVLHLGGICSVAGLGGNPYRNGSLKYYFKEPVVVDDFKGTGPFILACLERERNQGCFPM